MKYTVYVCDECDKEQAKRLCTIEGWFTDPKYVNKNTLTKQSWDICLERYQKSITLKSKTKEQREGNPSID